MDNANAGGADDNSCYVNASYIAKQNEGASDDWKYTFTSAEVLEQPHISASDLTMLDMTDGKATFQFADNGSVKVNYTQQYQDMDPHAFDRTVYGSGLWTYNYCTATVEGETVTIDYNDIYTHTSSLY